MAILARKLFGPNAVTPTCKDCAGPVCLSSIHVNFELGSGGCCSKDKSALWLYWKKTPNALITKRRSLSVKGVPNLKDFIKDEDGKSVRQILSDAALIDFQDLTDGIGYTLNYYTVVPGGAKSGTLYGIAGAPFKTVRVENPGVISILSGLPDWKQGLQLLKSFIGKMRLVIGHYEKVTERCG